jgi:type II secretory pathway pseudopilin PulG
MTLGIALILIFVLYLIDKHNRWRQAIKITITLIILAILGVGGLFGWQKYETWQAAQQEAQQEAEQARRDAQKAAELAKTCKDWEDKHPVGSLLDKANSKEDGKKTPAVFALSPPQDCVGPLEAAYYNSLAAWVTLNNPPKPTSDHTRHVRAVYGIDLTTKELGQLKCGEVKAGEVVTLLEDGQVSGIKVKTTDGQVGWAPESMFEVVK